ncbi:MAG: N-acetylneuraminate synthase family protein [Treponema sp.]|jgi:sialic acid synthase SpsE|nr:N-acetylneuraminate synthase family protein [Treponema sp.]
MTHYGNFCINGKTYGVGPDGERRTLIIAELGTGHGADRIRAAELIDAAAEAGADCIKFQIVYADEILHPHTGAVPLPGGSIDLYDAFKRLETRPDFFADMKEAVEKKGLLFLCTPFGLKSARDLRALQPAVLKIASPELNYTALLREIASYNLPVLLSSGVSTLSDIEAALSALSGVPVCLLHCVTAYPAPAEDYNLRALRTLSAVFGVPAGLSDHSMDAELVPFLAAALGAAVIEKHFCLSRKDAGLDDPIALDPPSFAVMARAVRTAERIAAEQGSEAALAAMRRERGGRAVDAALGDGVKRLAPSEKANYARTNRSIHALRSIREGEIITREMIACLRSEKALRPGLPPSWEDAVIGRAARTYIPDGEGVRFEDV